MASTGQERTHDLEVIRTFLAEGFETIDVIDRATARLAKNRVEAEPLAEMLASIATLRNACRALGFRNLSEICFEGSILLNYLQHELLAVTPEIVAVLKRMAFAINCILRNIQNSGREGDHPDRELAGALARLQESD